MVETKCLLQVLNFSTGGFQYFMYCDTNSNSNISLITSTQTRFLILYKCMHNEHAFAAQKTMYCWHLISKVLQAWVHPTSFLLGMVRHGYYLVQVSMCLETKHLIPYLNFSTRDLLSTVYTIKRTVIIVSVFNISIQAQLLILCIECELDFTTQKNSVLSLLGFSKNHSVWQQVVNIDNEGHKLELNKSVTNLCRLGQ